MARPRKGLEKNRTHHVGFRATDEVKAALDETVIRTGKSMADVLNELVEKELLGKAARRRKLA